MYRNQNSFSKRADLASVGDRSAKLALHQEMEPAVVRMVRRVLEQGALQSALDMRILAEATQVGLDAKIAAGADGDRLVRQVAQRVCSLVLSGAGPGREPRRLADDTIRN